MWLYGGDVNEIVVKEQTVPVRAIKEEVKVVTPVYIWKTGKTMFLSKKEKIVADTFLGSHSYIECERALKREGINRTWQSCRRWLQRERLQAYLNEQMEERGVYVGWTKERWYLKMTRHLDGTERLKDGDGYFMNLMAKYKGWGTEGIQMNNNVLINFTEKG